MNPANQNPSIDLSFEPTIPPPPPVPIQTETTSVLPQPPVELNSETGPTTQVVNSGSNTGGSNKKKILAALGVAILVLGIASGVFLVRGQQLQNVQAWDCTLYSFALSESGVVSVLNGSGRSEPQQQAQVYINGNLVETFNVPALDPGEGATLGTVSVPQNEDFAWRIDGTADCQNSGGTQSSYSAQCINVLAYDENWTQLNSIALSNLEAGEIVRFTVRGTTTRGTIAKARFSVNGGVAVESTNKKPGTDEFFYEYVIPANTASFRVKAELSHSESGWF